MLSLPKHPSSPATAQQLQRLLFRVAGNVMRALRVILPLLLVTLSPRLDAQDTPLWRYATTEDISFYRLTPLGDLAVATRDELTALDAATGEEIWSRADLADLRDGAFEVIPLTPFGVVRSKDGIALIDLASGATLWDSTSVPLTVRGYFAILPHEMMLLYGETAESDQTLMAVDLETGALLWRQDRLLEEKPPLEKIDGIHTFAGHQPPLLDTDSTMIVFISQDGPLKLHVGTGDLIWRVPELAGKHPPLLSEWYAPLHPAGGALLVAYDAGPVVSVPLLGSQRSNDKPRLMAIDRSNGVVMWDREVVVTSGPEAVRQKWREATIQVAEIEVVSLYDQFQADLRAKGFVVERTPEAPGGWLVKGAQPVSESLRRAILGLLERVERVPEGLLVRSAPIEGKQVIDLLDPKTGDAIWPDGVLTEIAAPGLVVDNRVYVGQRDGLLAIDLNSGAAGVIASFELAGCEKPTMLEQLGDGLLVRSENSLMMLDTRGAERFHRFYRKGGCGSEILRDVGKIVGVLAVLAAVVVSALSNSHVYQDAEGGWTLRMNADPSEIDPSLLDFSWFKKFKELYQLLTGRYIEELGLGDYAFMSDKDGNPYSIVKVRKSDGEEIDRLRLGKKSQDHIVDGISGTVFVKQDDREVLAFRFP